MTNITFNGTAAHAERYRKKLLSAFNRVLSHGVFLHGQENKKLANHLQKILGGNITLVSSGHDALLLALQSLKLNPTDEVIIPANAYPTAFPAALSGAKLVLADVDQNGQLSSQLPLTRHTKVVIMVHMYGLVGNIEAIQKLCKKNNIILIEDCAQAFGTTYKNKPVGTFGDIACFSFYPTKNLGSLGDGGAIRTNNKKIHTYLEQATSYGEKIRYKSEFVSGHSRIPELQAAGLNVYIENFRDKKKVYEWYTQSLPSLPSHPDSDPNHHLFVISVKNRTVLRKYLSKHGIPTLIHYPKPIHLVNAFRYLGYKNGDFPVAETLSKTILSLPFHQYMTKREVQYIIALINEWYKTNRQ